MEHNNFISTLIQDLQIKAEQKIYSFEDYLKLVTQNPKIHLRNAHEYIRDCMDYFGTTEIKVQGKKLKRFNLFDAPFDDGKHKLIGQEEAQNIFYSMLTARIKQNSMPKIMLLHGPNGSAKTTFFRVLMRALEKYSKTDEGQIFRFNWIFPSENILPSGIGFGKTDSNEKKPLSYAYLDGSKIDALFPDEFKDHPLLLIPKEHRKKILNQLVGSKFKIPSWILENDLHPRNRKIFDAMYNSTNKGLAEVFKYIQVERFFLSRKYRSSLVTVEPKMSVDAHIRQITSDQSLASLPPALQNQDLYRYYGDLTDANRGLIEFSDLFKKPIETFKYLINTLEEGYVNLDLAILKFDLCFTGSVNDHQFVAFTETPDFSSFEGRTEFVPMPYLLNYHIEQEIYKNNLSANKFSKTLAPYTFEIASIWAVMTRLVKPACENTELGNILSELSVYDKALLYGDNELPKNIPSKQASDIKDLVPKLSYQKISDLVYEGGIGASPRLVTNLLLKAATNPDFQDLNPSALFIEIENFMQVKITHEFLNYPSQEGGFHDIQAILEFTKKHWEKRIEKTLWQAAGLIEETLIKEKLIRYIELIKHHFNKEKIKNPLTGKYENPSPKIMSDFEKELDINEPIDEVRKSFISRIGAFKLDHPDSDVDYAKIFAPELEYINKKSMENRKTTLLKLIEMVRNKLTKQPYPQDKKTKEKINSFIKNMYDKGYNELSLIGALDFYFIRNI